ncbi:response regulator [Fictibacillus aquaticus]|uniref:DNA-binding response regulator n=1 Tax=Fictibacillus aquaticus TaxID=2021314 RepID=A0A235F7E7_9BACL|nr:response regulator transcription factor [Fictibacillus aquaticus]OYD56887.1 DNA-binding response regulator [Fictibacillus aquaticus]
MKTILIVDDEPKLTEVISSYLKKEGFQTAEAENGKRALELINSLSVDLVVLDLMLPDMNGEEVCKIIRQESDVPVLMLTAKVKEEDRINGLYVGADDYMVKPFSPRELVMRIKTVLRRTEGSQLLAEKISYNNGQLVIDAGEQEVFVHDKKVSLTPNEYKTLLVFARHPKRPFSREELVEKVLGYDFEGSTRTIDQHVKNLRQKIEKDPKAPQYIQTVFGVGYKFAGGSNV